MAKSVVHVALAFVEWINEHDVDGLVALITEEDCFVDNLAQVVRGREQMKTGWRAYVGWFPDYCVRVDSVNGELLVKNHWEIPAAWKAVTPARV